MNRLEAHLVLIVLALILLVTFLEFWDFLTH
jgi:hypothetical protein